MVHLFDLKNNKVVFSPQVLLIKEFKTLWERDKTKDKDIANKELAYIYFLCDYRSIYNRYTTDEKKERIKGDLNLGKTWKEDKQVLEAITKYNELSKTKLILLLEDAEYAIDKLRHYYRSLDFTSLDMNGKPIYSAKDFIANTKQLGQLVKGLNELKEEIKKAEETSSIMRGGREKSPFEDDDFGV